MKLISCARLALAEGARCRKCGKVHNPIEDIRMYPAMIGWNIEGVEGPHALTLLCQHCHTETSFDDLGIHQVLAEALRVRTIRSLIESRPDVIVYYAEQAPKCLSIFHPHNRTGGSVVSK